MEDLEKVKVGDQVLVTQDASEPSEQPQKKEKVTKAKSKKGRKKRSKRKGKEITEKVKSFTDRKRFSKKHDRGTILKFYLGNISLCKLLWKF